MVTRPFMVDDYVKIGKAEGEVKEITLNYVKIFTPTYTIMEVPNRVVLNSTIHRLMNNDMIDYSFEVSFAEKIWSSAWLALTDIFKKVLNPTIDEFWAKHRKTLPRKPELSVENIGHMKKTVMIRIFFPKGSAKLLYNLQGELKKMILYRLDELREKSNNNN
jgi:small-conductance mechanosensitive channel